MKYPIESYCLQDKSIYKTFPSRFFHRFFVSYQKMKQRLDHYIVFNLITSTLEYTEFICIERNICFCCLYK